MSHPWAVRSRRGACLALIVWLAGHHTGVVALSWAHSQPPGPAAAANNVSDKAAEFTRMMNLGKAQLENRSSADAVAVFTQAIKLDPSSVPAQRNLARAYFLGQNFPGALDSLATARKLEPDSVGTYYLTGLALVRMSRFEDALPHMESAVRLDAQSAALRYQLAGIYQAQGQHDRALEQLRETIRLDPLHVSAHFKLGTHARQAGDQVEFRRRMDEFTRLRAMFGDDTRSVDALERCTYTLPEPSAIPSPKPPCKPISVRFVDETDRVFKTPDDGKATAISVIEADPDGRYTVFVTAPDGTLSLLAMSKDGALLRRKLDLTIPADAKVLQCVAGNFHDEVPQGEKFDHAKHARNDVVIVTSAGIHLLKRTGEDVFRDITEASGLKGVSATRARWADVEHDGDLDLLLVGGAGLQLWQNNGNATFENVTVKVGIEPTGSATDTLAVDLDANVAIDLIVACGPEPTWVFENQRTGRFRRMPEPPGPWAKARRLLADDLNNDGHVDVVLIGEKAMEVRWGQIPGRIQSADLEITPAGGTLLDFDNDGHLEIALYGAARGGVDEVGVRVFRLDTSGPGVVSDVTDSVGLKDLRTPPVKDLVALDFDGDGDTDLLTVSADDRVRFLSNDGGNVNRQLKLRLATIKTNPSGFGTHIEAREDLFWVTRSVTQVPIEIGLCRREKLDALQTVWTNGVVDNEINVRVERKPLTIVEKNVATGSCPFLYAWDGKRFRFVTDLLGNSPIGLPISREIVLPADPDEIVFVGTDADLRPRDGSYPLQVTSEFREVIYLDVAKLLVVDHPPDAEVHPTDKIMFPPFPPSEVWSMTKPRELRSAIGDDGVDRTDAVRRIDGAFAPPGPILPPPLRGMCQPMALTIDFGDLSGSDALVLALTGWLQYGDGSRNIALSQNPAIPVIAPVLEARDGAGQWRTIDVAVGIPAGKTKTIVCDLSGKLPRGTDLLRLTTTFEVRWDRVALFDRLPPGLLRVVEVSPDDARLQWRGFSDLRGRSPGHPTTPDHDMVFAHPPWRTTPQGWCTAYGDVLELVGKRDEQLVILNAGDALTLRFDADAVPATQEGMKRSFFFYSVGWDKDGDHNVVDGDAVDPLPVTPITLHVPEADDPAYWESLDMTKDNMLRSDWRFRYNTRWVPGNRFRGLTPPVSISPGMDP